MSRSRLHLPRRDFLKGLGVTAAGGLAAACRKDGDSGELQGSIEHVVFVMMENRSFDHVFGSYSLLEGRTEVDGLTADMSNDDTEGNPIHPFEAHDHCLDDPPHGWDISHEQFASGANTGFVEAYAQRGASDPRGVMGYYKRSQLPTSYALADAYTLCDRWFCSVMGPTWPNRLFSHAATSQGSKGNQLLDSKLYTAKTIWHQLDELDEPWSYFNADGPMLYLFEGMAARSEIQWHDDFFAACDAGTLPKYCQIEPAFSASDDHPPHHPLLGQIFLAAVHNAIAASPLWNKTLLVITYDEHGGFFDHVPPPKTADDLASDGFDQLGFRIPALVCGPWARVGHVDSEVRDHTSLLAHVQRWLGLDPLNARNAAASDLATCIDDDRLAANDPSAPAELPVIELTEEEIAEQCTMSEKRAEGQNVLLQPELEAFLNQQASAMWKDSRKRIASLPRRIAELGERYGACVIR